MRRKAFTLLELLTVIAIIGVLAGVTSYVVASSMVRSRDSQRLGHIRLISSALEQYYSDLRAYPTFVAPASGTSPIYAAKWQLGDEADTASCSHKPGSKLLAPLYLTTIPEDPRSKLEIGGGAAPICTVSSYDGQYLYLSYSSLLNGHPAETGAVPDAKSPAIGYWLLAKTERVVTPIEPFLLDGPYYNLRPMGFTIDQSAAATHNYWVRNSHNN